MLHNGIFTQWNVFNNSYTMAYPLNGMFSTIKRNEILIHDI